MQTNSALVAASLLVVVLVATFTQADYVCFGSCECHVSDSLLSNAMIITETARSKFDDTSSFDC